MKATVIHRSLATGITRHVAVIEANTLAGLKAVATRQEEKEAAGLEQATAQDTTTEERTFLFVRHSANAKTGDIPQIYTDKESCPVTCPIKDECYGKGYYTDKAWKRTHLKLSQLAQELAKIPAGTLVRHNVAGDMAITGTGYLDTSLVKALAEAFKGLKAYTYTHCQLTAEAVQAIKEAQGSGFLINASCENLAQVLKAKALGINAVMVVPEAPEAPVTYQDGIKLVQCPAEWQGKTCKECGLCAKDREAVITFTAHGQKKKALADKLTEQPITFFRKS